MALSGMLCVLTASTLFYTGIWHDLSVSLDMTPWREGQDAALAEALVNGTPPEEVPLRCPFYKGEPPEAQCRACGTVVSRSGLHEVRVRQARTGAGWERRVSMRFLCSRAYVPLLENDRLPGAAGDGIIHR